MSCHKQFTSVITKFLINCSFSPLFSQASSLFQLNSPKAAIMGQTTSTDISDVHIDNARKTGILVVANKSLTEIPPKSKSLRLPRVINRIVIMKLSPPQFLSCLPPCDCLTCQPINCPSFQTSSESFPI